MQISGHHAAQAATQAMTRPEAGKAAQSVGHQAKAAVAAAAEMGAQMPRNAQGLAASAVARGIDPAVVFAAFLPQPEPEPAVPVGEAPQPDTTALEPPVLETPAAEAPAGADVPDAPAVAGGDPIPFNPSPEEPAAPDEIPLAASSGDPGPGATAEDLTALATLGFAAASPVVQPAQSDDEAALALLTGMTEAA